MFEEGRYVVRGGGSTLVFNKFVWAFFCVGTQSRKIFWVSLQKEEKVYSFGLQMELLGGGSSNHPEFQA